MATATSTDNKRKFVKCFRRTALDEIGNTLKNCIKSSMQKNIHMDEEDNLKCTERLLTIFENAVEQNVYLETTSTNDENSSRVNVPPTDLEGYFFETILPAENAALVTTTRKRKNCPKRCAQYLDKRIKLEIEAYKNIKTKICQDKAQSSNCIKNILPVCQILNEEMEKFNKIPKELCNLQEKLKTLQYSKKSLITMESDPKHELLFRPVENDLPNDLLEKITLDNLNYSTILLHFQ